MALKSIKDKIASAAGAEILGKTEEKIKKENVKRKVERKPKKPRQPRKPKQPKEVQTKKKQSDVMQKAPIKKIEKQEDESRVDDLVMYDENIDEGYKDVLTILGIKEKLDIDVDFKSHQLDYINFGQTTPVGLDYDEVSDFISRTKYTLHKLESALKQREKDIVTVASEVKKIEKRMIEQNEEKELERMIGGKTQEEQLIEEVMELKVENNELRKENKKLRQEIERLKKENKKQVTSTHSTKKAKGNRLPTPPMKDLDEDDIFGDMLENIGGLYDDEE